MMQRDPSVYVVETTRGVRVSTHSSKRDAEIAIAGWRMHNPDARLRIRKLRRRR